MRKEKSREEWALDVLNWVADYAEIYNGDIDKLVRLISKNLKKIITAFIILVKDEYRDEVVKWLERISAAIS